MQTTNNLHLATVTALLLVAIEPPPKRALLAAEGSPTAGVVAVRKARCYGTVSDTQGKPVEGATVEYWQREAGLWPYQGGGLKPKERSTTGTDGAFEIHTARSVGLLLARKPGLALTWRQLDQRFRPARDEKQALVMTPSASLSGLVVGESDTPIANATVSVSVAITDMSNTPGMRVFNYLTGKPARDFFVTPTDAAGRFLIEDFPTNASAALAVQSPGKALRPRKPEADSMKFRGYRAGDDIKLVMDPAGTIEGQILAEGEHEAPRAVRLVLRQDNPGFFGDLGQGEPVEAAKDGSFVLNEVTAGSFHLGAIFGTNGFPEWVAESVPVSVEAGKPARGVQLVAKRGGVLEVVVRRKSDHEALADAVVGADKSSLRSSAGSDSNGVALLRLTPGDYQVSVFRDSGQEGPLPATVEAGKTNRLEFELSSR
jgi:hypothetical protein